MQARRQSIGFQSDSDISDPMVARDNIFMATLNLKKNPLYHILIKTEHQ
jgi:hypothetical protein